MKEDLSMKQIMCVVSVVDFCCDSSCYYLISYFEDLLIPVCDVSMDVLGLKFELSDNISFTKYL